MSLSSIVIQIVHFMAPGAYLYLGSRIYEFRFQRFQIYSNHAFQAMLELAKLSKSTMSVYL